MSRHEQARAILEALFQRRPPSEGISEARLYAMGREYPPDELGVSFGTVMLEEAEKMPLEGRLELYRSGNAYYFRPRVVNKTQ